MVETEANVPLPQNFGSRRGMSRSCVNVPTRGGPTAYSIVDRPVVKHIPASCPRHHAPSTPGSRRFPKSVIRGGARCTSPPRHRHRSVIDFAPNS